MHLKLTFKLDQTNGADQANRRKSVMVRNFEKIEISERSQFGKFNCIDSWTIRKPKRTRNH